MLGIDERIMSRIVKNCCEPLLSRCRASKLGLKPDDGVPDLLKTQDVFETFEPPRTMPVERKNGDNGVQGNARSGWNIDVFIGLILLPVLENFF
ncbi:hypothetical protein WME85_46335 [Sorangium sp. So ce1153]